MSALRSQARAGYANNWFGQGILACTILLGLTFTGLAVQHTQQQQYVRHTLAAQRAFVHLQDQEQRTGELEQRLAALQEYLYRFPGTEAEPEVKRLRDACLFRLEERDLENTRQLGRLEPMDYRKRQAAWQQFLDRYPTSSLANEARGNLAVLIEEWDRHDCRALRDRFVKNPGDFGAMVEQCRAYVNAHPHGRFVKSAREILRWTERIMTPEEYRVTLQSGQFEKQLARYFSRGPDLSVEIEVAGVRYGPSTIVVNSYQPQWSYDFPRPIRWKAGDPVTIRVRDHDYGMRTVLEITSTPDDPLALRWLSGEVWSGGNALTFRSDFFIPELPAVE